MAPESWEAYQIDLATYQLGVWVENQLAERTKDGKPVHKLAELLEPEEGEPGPQFVTLAGRATKKMKIPENGIW